MNDDDKARFLIRFTAWCKEQGVTLPTSDDVFRFMESQR